MAQSKSPTKKSIVKTTSKKADAKAKKALARAEKSVRKARKAVKHSSRTLRAQAAELSKKTEKLEAKHAKAARELRSARAVAVVAAEPTPAVVTPPPLPKPEAAAPTLIELRRRAKESGVTGYSRMNKAALLAAVEGAAPSK